MPSRDGCWLTFALAASAVALGCNSGPPPIVYGDAAAGSAETPPVTDGPDVEAWLRQGDYKSWHSQPAAHAPLGPSPHGSFNRTYSNDVINPIAVGTGAWPQGVASVKELYNNETDTTPAGYAVSVKTQASSASGANWFWYERLPDGTIEGDGLNASACVGCHGEAGQDSAHTTVTGGSRDFVYTPVP